MGGVRHDCGVRPEDLGPFLLGQLAPHEAALVADSVAACPSCSRQVEQLRPVAAALGRVSITTDDVVPVPPPALERVLASVRDERAARRRRWRTRLTLAAAAVVLLLVTLAGALVARDDPGREVSLTGSTTATGDVLVSERGWGTAVRLDVRGLQPGRTYGAWLADGEGERMPAGTFRALADGTARLELGASMRLDEARSVGVTLLGGDDVLAADLGT